MLGERMGKWVIFKEIGRGGMGHVYLAQEEVGGRNAALKVLTAELAQDVGFLQRFQGEIETLSRLDHPGIVKFFESGFENGLHFFAMEYVDGQSLDKVLEKEGRLPWQEVLDIAIKICGPLRHVHDSGVIHRDIKPPNILRTQAGDVKLTDFGIARIFASRHLTATGGVVGTAEFLSPEQASGKPVTKRSDLYSLGVVLYMLLTGRTPFEGNSFLDLLHKHRYAQFDSPRRIVPELPYEMDELVCQLLEKEPEKRPADCQVLGRQLESIRRKLERKNNLTSLGEDELTVAENRVDRLPLESRPGPATLMSRAVREELERQQQAGPIGRFFNQVWVIVPLLILCIGTIVYALWPPSAEYLFQNGSALMERSSRLSEKEEAWREYLEPLNTRFPDHPYKDKVAEYHRLLLEARGELPSEAQQFFLQGERRRQEGDLKGARKMWRGLVEVFAEVPAEKTWVKKARQALEELDKDGSRKDRWQTVRPALSRAEQLAAAGRRDEAEKIWSALEELYGRDPYATEILAEVSKARKAAK